MRCDGVTIRTTIKATITYLTQNTAPRPSPPLSWTLSLVDPPIACRRAHQNHGVRCVQGRATCRPLVKLPDYCHPPHQRQLRDRWSTPDERGRDIDCMRPACCFGHVNLVCYHLRHVAHAQRTERSSSSPKLHCKHHPRRRFNGILGLQRKRAELSRVGWRQRSGHVRRLRRSHRHHVVHSRQLAHVLVRTQQHIRNTSAPTCARA